jgi:ankyrin repeat protein
MLDTGCTPLLRATLANDMEVVQLLLARGASPNINAMGVTPFLAVAGAGTGQRGGPAATNAGGGANKPLMDLLIQHGADVNAPVTGTKTYSMRIARAPSTNEGMTALHFAAQAGRADLVRYLLEKGANTQIADSNGHKPIDLVDDGATKPSGRGVARGGATAPSTAEIRALLENVTSKK